MRPVRSLADAWATRSSQYRDWLTRDEYTLVLAERDGEPIGYAVVSIGGDVATWDVGTEVAEIETLSVLESERGSGVGRALIDECHAVAREVGVETVVVGVAHANADAIRFYEREGFSDFYVLLMRS